MEIKERYQDVNYCLRCSAKLELSPDREGKTRPACPQCGWIYYKNPVPAAACVIINEQRELLVIKRKFEPKAGQWALPSGYIEIDQTPEEAAIAEMQEETGLTGEINKFLDYHMGFSPIYEKVLSMGYLMKITGGELKAGDDALEAVFSAFDKLPPIAFAGHRHFITLVRKDNLI